MNEEEYALGADVTEMASASSPSEDVVLSIRLKVPEVLALEEAARLTRQDFSQVVRDALHQYLPRIAGRRLVSSSGTIVLGNMVRSEHLQEPRTEDSFSGHSHPITTNTIATAPANAA